jgi:large conductance mechanosensitive channel
MGFFKEFMDFAMKGNVIDLAVGIVIGAAFSKIVDSLVNDVITPAILTPALKAAKVDKLEELVIPGTGIRYGSFISAVITFFIIAFVLFILVKIMNKATKKDVYIH